MKISSLDVSLERNPSANVLLAIEFKVIHDPYDKLQPLRLIDSLFAENEFEFDINGYVHGKKIFQDDIRIILSGRKIIYSIE